jgi:phospholipase C
MQIKRRDFLRYAAAASGAAWLGRTGRSALHAAARDLSLPPPSQSGIEHIVAVTMENRSFDHFMGWLPNADGQQGGLTYLDAAGVAHATHPLAPDYTGCPHPDPDHSYAGGRVQYDGGAMDGFLRSGSNDDFSIGYYVESDQPFYGALARNYLTLDRYFCSILGPTFPNRLFLHAAQTDRISNTAQPATMPTIWDRLAERHISGAYYFANVPFLGLWGAKYTSISRPYSQFLVDAATGRLPAVSFVDPRYTVLDDGTGNDDHPHADIRSGDAFLAEAFHAVATGPDWHSTVFIVNFDEWGGFFDHVPPPRAAAPNTVDPDMVNGKTLLGFRVPTVIASPFTRGDALNPLVSSVVCDHTSVLKLIEWRWKLDPLTARDASNDIANLAQVLRFDNPQVDVPILPQPVPPPPVACPGGGIAFESGA